MRRRTMNDLTGAFGDDTLARHLASAPKKNVSYSYHDMHRSCFLDRVRYLHSFRHFYTAAVRASRERRRYWSDVLPGGVGRDLPL
jgi:hypothetical protein